MKRTLISPCVLSVLVFAAGSARGSDIAADRKVCANSLTGIEALATAKKVNLADQKLASIIVKSAADFKKDESGRHLLHSSKPAAASLERNGAVLVVTYHTGRDQLGGATAFLCDVKSGEVLAFAGLK